MTSSFDTFRNRTIAENQTDNHFSTQFIERSTSSVTIKHNRINRNIKAALTKEHKEGVDKTLLFTYNNIDAAKNVRIGDYLLYENTTYLTFMEFNLPTKVRDLYKKHKLVECNVEIKVDSVAQKAAYIGSLNQFTAVSEETTGSLSLAIEQYKPVIVTVDNPLLHVNKRFLLGAEAFVITAVDRLSNTGIMYISANAVPYNVTLDKLEEGIAITPSLPQPNVIEDNMLKQGASETLETNFGYVVFDHMVTNLRRSMNSFTFTVPYGITSLTITTKDTESNLVSTTYQVVI